MQAPLCAAEPAGMAGTGGSNHVKDKVQIAGLESGMACKPAQGCDPCRGRDWVAAELDLRHDAKLSLFETVIRVVGGLLSAYDASRDAVFLERADALATAAMRNMLNDGTGAGTSSCMVSSVTFTSCSALHRAGRLDNFRPRCMQADACGMMHGSAYEVCDLLMCRLEAPAAQQRPLPGALQRHGGQREGCGKHRCEPGGVRQLHGGVARAGIALRQCRLRRLCRAIRADARPALPQTGTSALHGPCMPCLTPLQACCTCCLLTTAGSVQQSAGVLCDDASHARVHERSAHARLQAFLPVWFNRHTGLYNPGNTYTVGGLADSYFESLLKMWLLRDKRVRLTSPAQQGLPVYTHAADGQPLVL